MTARDIVMGAAGAAGTTADKTYIEDVFSTYLYTGNGSTQTINNGIQLGAVYGGSVYFNGLASPNTDRLSIANNSALDLGTGDFTLECWFFSVKPLTSYNIEYAHLFGKGAGANPTDYAIGLYQQKLYFQGLHGSITMSANQWVHVAVTRSSGTVRIFVNGVFDISSTNTSNFTNTESFNIGDRRASDPYAQYPFNGYISNIRIVKGTALYTSNFTPSTTPLTAVSGTALLTCQNPNPILDYSSNALTITNTNATSTTGGGPFNDPSLAKGGMVWTKLRTAGGSGNYYGHLLFDTARGSTKNLKSNSTSAETTYSGGFGLNSFNSNGFTVKDVSDLGYGTNENNTTYASWTFRKAPKFFDVVTWTGDGTYGRAIPHSLKSTPGMIFIKRTDISSDWVVYHNSWGFDSYFKLNSTNAPTGADNPFMYTTSTNFGVTFSSLANQSGGTYVAYLFAHDTSSDGLIQCGGFNGATDVNLGWEPQYLLIKRADSTGGWFIWDTMRGLNATGNLRDLYANLSNAEAEDSGVSISSTGFTNSAFTGLYIYMAIRRGPMRTPTDGTKVFKPVLGVNCPAGGVMFNTDFPVDSTFEGWKIFTGGPYTVDRLRGNYMCLTTSGTNAEFSDGGYRAFDSNVGLKYNMAINGPSYGLIGWNFQRAPGFFDVVCYTGTGVSGQTFSHNLKVAPELMIHKSRTSGTAYWHVYHKDLPITQELRLEQNVAATTYNAWNNTHPTSSVFTLATDSPDINGSGQTYVAYLFASCPGVSKVGSYTGNGSSQTINCGFSAGARFVLIKRTNSTGDWYVWDTARGIVAGNDPHLSLNSAVAEVTTNDTIDPDSTGFIVNQVAATNVNVSGGSYIYLAIA